MANVIELVNKYLPILDEQYRVESRSAILDTPEEFVQQTKEAKKVKIAKINVDGLADYSRQSGFTTGSMDLTWEEHEYRVDRGRALQVDALDNMETFGLAWGRLAGTFQKEKVIPEMDAYRFAEYYKKAGIKRNVALTTSNILSTIDDIVAEQDDSEVPEDGKIIFVIPTIYSMMMNDTTILKNIDVDDGASKVLNKKIYAYNGMPIIKVPSNRFYTSIDLLTGRNGEELGGYKASAGAGVIGMMIISKPSVLQLSKRLVSRFWAPTRSEMDLNKADGVNPDADAWKFDFRAYHDAWVLENKEKGIAAVTASSLSVTSVDIGTDDPTLIVAGELGTRVAEVNLAERYALRLTSKVIASAGVSQAVVWSTSDREVGIVDGSGSVALLSTGVVTVKATSVYDPTKFATIEINVVSTGFAGAAPTLLGLTSIMSSGAPISGVGNEITVPVSTTTTYIVAQLSKAVKLVGTPVVKIDIEGTEYTYGTIELDTVDKSKLIITPSGTNGETTATPVERTLTVAANSVVSLSGIPNEAISIYLTTVVV